MIRLPVELQRKCIHFVRDISTLRSLRLVNKANAVATEALFHTVNVFANEESVERYTKIIKDADLNAQVRNVVFHTALGPDETSTYSTSHVDKVLAMWERAAISQLPKFRNVNEVQLKFARECAVHLPWGLGLYARNVTENPAFRAKVYHKFFEAVANVNCIDSLTIVNLQDHTDNPVYELQALQDVRSRLKKVHLQFTTASRHNMGEGTIMLLELITRENFFAIHLFNNWVPSVRNEITHLTLYATRCYWGIFPFCDLRSVLFPNLRSLALGMFTIAHDWQIDWIIAHGSTLRSLILDRCPIVVAVHMTEKQIGRNWRLVDMQYLEGSGSQSVYSKGIDLRWGPILDRFSYSLPKLRHFAMGRGDWKNRKMFEERYELVSGLEKSRYIVFDCGIELMEWIEGGSLKDDKFVHGDITVELPGDEEDGEELKRLTRMVYERT